MIRLTSALLLSLATLLAAQTPAKKLETYLLLPEPSAMRLTSSRPLGGGQKTVLTPAHETTDTQGVKAYTDAEFAKLGISVETFTERAQAAADARLAQLQPEFIKDEEGKTRYAVYRGESPLIATLISAPSLGKKFTRLLGTEMWAVLPDRHSLYLFPAKPEMLAEFAADLQRRFNTDPYAASCEVFQIKPGEAPRAIGTFDD